MSNFPFSYKLSWLPRLLMPSMAGDRSDLLPGEGRDPLPAPEKTARLVFLGDISAVANRQPPVIHEELREILRSANLVIGNCEAPVVERPAFPLATRLGMRHSMTAGFLAAVLDAAAISPDRLILTLANNHMLDQGPEGLAETEAKLDALGIATIGGMRDPFPRIAMVGDVTVALFAFTAWRNAPAAEFDVAVVTRERFLSQWPTAGQKADLDCVVPHWDREFRHFPSEETRRLARELAASGAGLIVGHHAHVLQPATMLGRTLAAFGLGDFLGTALPRIPWPARLGAILCVDIAADPENRGRIAGWRVVPFFRKRDGAHERLVPLNAVEKPFRERILQRFRVIFPPGTGPENAETSA